MFSFIAKSNVFRFGFTAGPKTFKIFIDSSCFLKFKIKIVINSLPEHGQYVVTIFKLCMGHLKISKQVT